jgi:hypothetical protein
MRALIGYLDSTQERTGMAISLGFFDAIVLCLITFVSMQNSVWGAIQRAVVVGTAEKRGKGLAVSRQGLRRLHRCFNASTPTREIPVGRIAIRALMMRSC